MGKTGNRCIQARQAAEPTSSATSEIRHDRQSRKSRSMAGRRLRLPPGADHEASHERNPDEPGREERRVREQDAAEQVLGHPAADRPRQQGNPARQYHHGHDQESQGHRDAHDPQPAARPR